MSCGIFGREWQHMFHASFFPKKFWSFEDTCGSPGMLENRPTHEILQMTVYKYRPVAFPAGVATHFYCFLPKIVQLFPNIKTDTFYGAHYLCSTRQWLDEGWIDGGYSPNKVWIYMLFIHSTYVRYPHFTNAYALSTHHLGIPILYLPIICACPPHLG